MADSAETAVAASVADAVDLDPKEDDEHDSKEAVLLRYFLQEWELVKSLLDRIVAGGGVSSPTDVHKIRSIVSFLLLPHEILLLDSRIGPDLERIW